MLSAQSTKSYQGIKWEHSDKNLPASWADYAKGKEKVFSLSLSVECIFQDQF